MTQFNKTIAIILIVLTIINAIAIINEIVNTKENYEYITLTDNTTIHIYSYTTDDNHYKVISTNGDIYEFEKCDIISAR